VTRLNIDGTVARPSSPSVIFTAFVVAKNTKTQNGVANSPKSIIGSFTNGYRLLLEILPHISTEEIQLRLLHLVVQVFLFHLTPLGYLL